MGFTIFKIVSFGFGTRPVRSSQAVGELAGASASRNIKVGFIGKQILTNQS